MSLNTFIGRARLNITVTVDGGGEFSPFQESYGVPMSWSITGSATRKLPQIELTAKEITCGVPYGSDKKFRIFEMGQGNWGSTGNTSGTKTVGQIAPFSGVETSQTQLGTWTVNTQPQLSAGGKANGVAITDGYYVVNKPENKTVDDPIVINPPIDNLTRVYPGDIVFIQGTTNPKWSVKPKFRFPQPDRTFFWSPNTNPTLASGGMVDGERAKPGTIMIPEENHYIEDEDDPIDGMRYFYAGQGVMFDGQVWSKKLGDPTIYESEESPREFRNTNVAYVSDDLYEALFEGHHRQKPFVITNQDVDDDSPFQLTYDDGSGSETLDMFFRWFSPMNGAEKNMQPGYAAIHDFGDVYSNYHKSNFQWLKTRFPGIFSAGFRLTTQNTTPERQLVYGVECFENGNQTDITETVTVEGNELTNSISITLTIQTAFE
jgi:hypothetical protein